MLSFTGSRGPLSLTRVSTDELTTTGREPTRTGDADARGDAAGILPRPRPGRHEGGKPSMARGRHHRRHDHLESSAGPSDRGEKAAAGSLMRSCVLSFIALLLVAAPAAAQPCPALHVRNPDGNYIVPGVKGDIAYSGDLALDAYVQQGSARRPSVVVIHGGTWTAGSRVAHVGQILEVLTRAGYNWFSVDYRLGGLARFEDSLADVRAALAFIRCRSAELGIDAESAGAAWRGLGRAAGRAARSRTAGRRHGAVLIGGFYDLAAVPDLSRNIDRDILTRASPITRAVSRMPPLLVVHGESDSEVPAEQARRYCSQVSKPPGPAEAGGHARGAGVSSWESRARAIAARTGSRASGATSVRWSSGSRRSLVDAGSRIGRAAASWSRTSSTAVPRSSGSTRTFRARASRSPRSSSSMVAAGKPATR